MRGTLRATLLAGTFVACASAANATGLRLEHTAWARVARQNGLDPYLVYSVALAESRRPVSGDHVAPWPWTLNTPHGPRYFESRARAQQTLRSLLSEHPHWSIDIGLMQINTVYNGHRVGELQRLLAPATNLRVGAAILREAMESAPGRPVLGVGRYHSWKHARALAYGQRVWDIYARISPASRYALYFQGME